MLATSVVGFRQIMTGNNVRISHHSIYWLLRCSSDQLRSVVVDGITIGHPCCSQHDCPIPLASVSHRYCPVHSELEKQCSVSECENPASAGFKTCTESGHRELELQYQDRGKAMFQLKHRLEQIKSSQTHDSLSTGGISVGQHDDLEGAGIDAADQDVIVDENGICDTGKPDGGNRKLRARFGRRRTHNDELCVGSCGIILGRATFFGSEAPNGVRVR